MFTKAPIGKRREIACSVVKPTRGSDIVKVVFCQSDAE